MKEATLMFKWAEFHLLSIKAEHLPGIHNVEVDWLSRRRIDKGEWSSHPHIFDIITRVMGRLEIDHFASPNNTQVPVFLSRTPTPQALGVNALCYPWPQVLLYAFPPFSLIQAVLQRIKRFRVRVILVAPNWSQ